MTEREKMLAACPMIRATRTCGTGARAPWA